MFSIRMSQLKPVPALAALTASISLATVWILYVNHLVNTATIPGNDQHWVERARVEAYGVCYDGCNDCLDVGKIEAACRMTATVQLSSVVCDASRMWFWADRYPTECLQAVGGIYKEQDLSWKRWKLRSLYFLAAVTLAPAFAIYKAADWSVKWRQHHYQGRARHRHRDGPRESASTPLLRATTVSTALVSMLLFSTSVQGYACANWHPVHNQPFVSTTDPSLFGNIHGWLSDCYIERYACGGGGERCGSSSSDDDDDKGGTTCTTTTHWCDRERADASPGDFVRGAAGLVSRCGFKMVDIVPGVVDRRIANPRIEGELWVKVSVNRFNGSEGGVDGQVLCLSEIVEWPSVGRGRERSVWSRFRLGF
ncbi:hypothetical protein NKR19_g7889 [Coniochaeta hoffmannii]|uniref:Uncharacterized protein n=1 Tax=Coniochaeta hoffmannii TaxID=91930 RepID=A0AA38R5Y9_9PEZI|nr:hypothetical protein NKR19_g7889 [Coniochaeta hoffmannii]